MCNFLFCLIIWWTIFFLNISTRVWAFNSIDIHSSYSSSFNIDISVLFYCSYVFVSAALFLGFAAMHRETKWASCFYILINLSYGSGWNNSCKSIVRIWLASVWRKNPTEHVIQVSTTTQGHAYYVFSTTLTFHWDEHTRESAIFFFPCYSYERASTFIF